MLPLPIRLWVRSHREWRAGEAEIALLGDLWVRGRGFLDVGANLGLYTRAALAHGMHVVAIEPNPVLAANLRRLFPRGVRVLPLAASDRVGRSSFHLPSLHGREMPSRGSLESAANPGYTLIQIEVETAPLDSMDLHDLAMVKIDVEGHELAVLRGAMELLRRDHPTLLVEIEERHHPGGSATVFEFLRDLDYECFFFWRRALQPFERFDQARHQPSRRAVRAGGGRAPGEYVNNFLFVWRGDRALLGRLTRAAGFSISVPAPRSQHPHDR